MTTATTAPAATTATAPATTYPPTQFYTYNRVLNAVIPTPDSHPNALPASAAADRALKKARAQVGEDVWKKGYNPAPGGATEVGLAALAAEGIDATAGFFGILTGAHVSHFDATSRKTVKGPDARQKSVLPSKLMLFITRKTESGEIARETLSLELHTDFAQSVVASLSAAANGAQKMSYHPEFGDVILIDAEMTSRVSGDKTYYNERARLALNDAALGYERANPEKDVETTYVFPDIELLKAANKVEGDRYNEVQKASEAGGLGLDSKVIRDTSRIARRVFMSEAAEKVVKQLWVNGKDRTAN